ncbi:hypothetical protein F4813DRAFT_384409 [Daldinia decipiens]|uniref:uncharacterized protein n=1 Tax=Daldinia decipiens TaxID=326647 RepID=UPI0020C25963|nr:uncharacterized protein F4813DRAFT_384409 [Daldinia decipiens]KAI1662829.1 hypothetical protein F4813DRAFT_384409 [Daldinia decipiens]
MIPCFRSSRKFTPADPSIFSSVEVTPGPGSGPLTLHMSYGNNVRPFSQCLGPLSATSAYVTLAPFYYTDDESENALSMLAAIDTIAILKSTVSLVRH